MLYRSFEPLHREVSCIAMGSVPFGVTISETDSYAILDEYADMGGNFIDTARVYGDFQNRVLGVAEGVIGRWLTKTGMRDHMILGTKGGHPDLSDMHAGRLDRASVFSDMEKSLEALKTDHVDLYWLHRDDVSRPVDEIMGTLNELIQNGYCLAIGVSNWTTARILEANEYARTHALTPLIANQPQWSLAHTEYAEDDTLVQLDKPMYDMHGSTGLAAIPYSSQAKGFYIKYDQGGEKALSEKARRRFLSPRNLIIYDEIKRIQSETGFSVGAIALAYLYRQPFPTFPIVGVSSLAQAVALREASSAPLSDADVRALTEIAVR